MTPSMRLSELIADLAFARVVGDAGIDVKNVQEDSRLVAPGDVFVAVPGLTVDGHDFVPQVIERGAAAVVVERELPVSVPQVVVRSSSKALGWLAQRAAGRPSDRMTLCGVTGTNGKTTTTFLVEAMLLTAGLRPGVVGTVNYRYPGKVFDASYTTPTALQLAGLFREMADASCSHVVMETTSSALAFDRLEGVGFRVAGFTNLTLDHLEVHGSMEAYFEAKALLFSERIEPGGTAVAMIDDVDRNGERMLERVPAGRRRLSVSIHRKSADVAVLDREVSIAGLRATFKTPRGELAIQAPGLLGEFNLSNLALAVGLAEGLELSHEVVRESMARVSGVPGRVERVTNARGLDVFVDYAHTPDALERVIAALRPLTRGRLVCVFGCGGDRDTSKRPKMGRIAAEKADLPVVTSDNPRTEDPQKIVEQILVGVNDARPRETPIVEVDRRKAIALAVAAARPGQDVVLIAGKGHEDYQILGKTKIHFDDREEAAAAIAGLGA
jgi:UDP-N-acetylmuramyl-tripeptide synthetase